MDITLIAAPGSAESASVETSTNGNEEPKSITESNNTINDQAKLRKKSYRKVDVRLLGWYCLVHLALAVNVHNISNAAIINQEAGTGIKEQLGHLTSEQWALILSIFYCPFIIFEPFGGLMLKKFGPRRWMSVVMLIWGAVSACQASTQNFGGLLACRVLLGFTEAGFFGSILYHLSFWYPANELTLRVAVLAACGVFSGIFGGIIAYGVSFMNEKAGLAGWQWLFILEGVPPFLCGIFTALRLPNYPETAKFLTEDERTFVIAALPASQPSSQGPTWNSQEMKLLIKNPTFYCFFAIFALYSIGAHGFSSVLPTVILDLGIAGTAKTQLMSMPPSFVGAVCLLFLAWLIESRRIYPWPTAFGLMLLSCSCHIALILVRKPVARYVILLLATSSSTGVFPIIWPERIKSVSGTTSVGFALGSTSAARHLQGIVGPQIFQESFGPSYKISFIISTCLVGGSICAVMLTWYLLKKNERNDSVEATESSQQSISEREAKRDHC